MPQSVQEDPSFQPFDDKQSVQEDPSFVPFDKGQATGVSAERTFPFGTMQIPEHYASKATAALPWMGGMIGGALGAPGVVTGIGGAALGGAAGEAAKQLINRGLGLSSPSTSTEAAKNIGTQGAIQGGMQAGGELVGAAAKPLVGPITRAAEAQYARVFSPVGKAAKAQTERVVPGFLERGVTARSQHALGEKVGEGIQNAGDALNDALNNLPAGQTVNTAQVIQALEDAKTQFRVPGTSGQVQVLDAPIKALGELQQTVNDLGQNVSFGTLNKVRQIYDQVVSQAKGYAVPPSEGTKIWAQKQAADAIRSALAGASPDVAKAKAEFAFWKRAGDLLEDARLRQTGKDAGGPKVFSSLAMAGGIARGGIAGGAEALAAFRALEQLRGSTMWRTSSAVAKQRIADSIASGNFKEAITGIARLTGGTKAASKEVQPPPK